MLSVWKIPCHAPEKKLSGSTLRLHRMASAVQEPYESILRAGRYFSAGIDRQNDRMATLSLITADKVRATKSVRTRGLVIGLLGDRIIF